jgi:hypothetical protein
MTDDDRLWAYASRAFPGRLERDTPLPNRLARLPAEYLALAPGSSPEIPDWMALTNQRLIWRDKDGLQAIRLGVVVEIRWAETSLGRGQIDVRFQDGSEIHGIPTNSEGVLLKERLRVGARNAAAFPRSIGPDGRRLILGCLEQAQQRKQIGDGEIRNLRAFYEAVDAPPKAKR